jgi:CO dehydrogenase/acetyl-CoA synthase gamma subunit (corrinoid Fe-S protein)
LLTYHLSAELPVRVPQLVEAGQTIDLSQAQMLAMDSGKLQAALAARHKEDPLVEAAVSRGLKASFAEAIEALFPVALLLLGLTWLVTLTVPARQLRGRETMVEPDTEAATA